MWSPNMLETLRVVGVSPEAVAQAKANMKATIPSNSETAGLMWDVTIVFLGY